VKRFFYRKERKDYAKFAKNAVRHYLSVEIKFTTQHRKPRRHSEQSEESVAKLRGLPRRSCLTARNDGVDWNGGIGKKILPILKIFRFKISLRW